jgi:hypothetical protein
MRNQVNIEGNNLHSSTFQEENEKLDINSDDKSGKESILSPVKTKIYNHNQNGSGSQLTSMRNVSEDIGDQKSQLQSDQNLQP